VAGVALTALGWIRWRTWLPVMPRPLTWHALHVAFGDMDLTLVWQASHLVATDATSTPSREGERTVCLKTNPYGTLPTQEVTEVSAKL